MSPRLMDLGFSGLPVHAFVAAPHGVCLGMTEATRKAAYRANKAAGNVSASGWIPEARKPEFDAMQAEAQQAVEAKRKGER